MDKLTYIFLLVAALAVGYAIDIKEKTKTHWIQIPCPLSKAIIYDWGKCTHQGHKFDCTNAHWGFTAECVEAVNGDTKEQTIMVTHPRAVVVVEQEDDGK